MSTMNALNTFIAIKSTETMQVAFRNDAEKLHFIQYLEKLEIDNGLPAWDLIAIFQAYEAALSENKRLIERLSKAITYTSVALSTLEGK
jgi:hypothetical protein